MSVPDFLTPAERAAVEELLVRARAMLGPDLLEARLFGSRARGEGNESSDVDIAFIVTTRGRERRHAVHDLAFDIGLEHGVILAPTVIAKEQLDQLRARERLFAREIDRDGVPL